MAWSGFRGLDHDAAELANYEEARTLMRALDTRASELKYLGIKAIVLEDNSGIPAEVAEDTATIQGLMADLQKAQLEATPEQVAQFEQVWTGYIEAIAEFVDAAVATPEAMRGQANQIQRANDQMDEVLSGAIRRANDRIDQQSAKIALDKELLDLVRRALGIGIGLLEQQKQNVV